MPEEGISLLGEQRNPSPRPDIPRVGRGGSSAGSGRPRPPGCALRFPVLPAPWLAPRSAGTGPMRRWLRIMVPEEGSGCPVPRLPWTSVLRLALILSLTGVVAYCFLCIQLRGQPESPAVSRKGRRRKMQTSHPLCGAWGPWGAAGFVGAQRRAVNNQEETGIQAEGRCVWAQADNRPKNKSVKIKMRWRKIVPEDLGGKG